MVDIKQLPSTSPLTQVERESFVQLSLSIEPLEDTFCDDISTLGYSSDSDTSTPVNTENTLVPEDSSHDTSDTASSLGTDHSLDLDDVSDDEVLVVSDDESADELDDKLGGEVDDDLWDLRVCYPQLLWFKIDM